MLVKVSREDNGSSLFIGSYIYWPDDIKSQLADDSKPEGPANMPEGRAAIQRYIHVLKE